MSRSLVPVGTVVRDDAGEVLVDLDRPGMSIVVASGGRGGLGNEALASKARRPPVLPSWGPTVFEGDIHLELKVVADVALVGFPSAGKSSLIAAVSKATPKIADYPSPPFTRISAWSMWRGSDSRSRMFPVLFRVRAKAKGLGLEFLRHVERCSVLVHVLDCATLEPGRDPVSDLDALLTELQNYPLEEDQVPLAERPQVVVLNKVDVPEAKDLADFVTPELEERGYRVFPLSTVTREGLEGFLYALGEMVSEHRHSVMEAQAQPPRIVVRPQAVNEAPFTVVVEGGSDGPLYPNSGRKAPALGGTNRLCER